jgi:hypothetical protein
VALAAERREVQVEHPALELLVKDLREAIIKAVAAQVKQVEQTAAVKVVMALHHLLQGHLSFEVVVAVSEVASPETVVVVVALLAEQLILVAVAVHGMALELLAQAAPASSSFATQAHSAAQAAR